MGAALFSNVPLFLFQNELLAQQEKLSKLQHELDERNQTSTGQGQTVRN